MNYLVKKVCLSVLSLFVCVTVAQGQALYESPKADHSDISFYEPYSVELARVESEKVRNIILMIGDGMGVSQVSAARIRALGAEGELAFEKMPITGLVRTHSLDDLVTDSAASGTALSSGVKTNNGMIGWLPGGKKPVTILEAAQKKGMRTGLVATSTMTHATPGAFGAHRETRKDEAGIAEDLLDNRINILFGGGLQFFQPQSAEGSSRKDGRDLVAEAKDAGYTFVGNTEQMQSAQGDHILGLFGVAALTTAGGPEPSLAEMTEKALAVLNECRDGFFLMVEGSQIDWAGHGNDADYTVRQTLLFDEAVQKVLDFARADGRTLVVVTADHETGGMGINAGTLTGSEIEAAWTTEHHTGTQVPLYAYGPGSERFVGVMDGTEIPKIFARLLRIKKFPQISEE